MKEAPKRKHQGGFSLLELLVALGIFTILCGAAFSLLGVSQRRYQTESQVLDSFQEARLGLDQIVRDVHDSGYPPLNQFDGAPPAANLYASTPIAWNPSYPGTPCTIGTNCSTPGDFDLIFETDINPQRTPPHAIQWVRYQLRGTTLFRGVVDKVAGGDPAATTAPALVPYVQNVLNNATSAQIAQFRAVYPTMYPGGGVVPIFRYICDTPTLQLGPLPCSSAGADNSPANIRDIEITLIVMALQPDAQTGQPRLVELRGRVRRVNPNQ
jgi:prepilin-type N-terminal cleavage/methylation domain-containing protein